MRSPRIRLLTVIASVAIAGVAAGILFIRFSASELVTFMHAERSDQLTRASKVLAERYEERGSWAGVESLLDQIHRTSGRALILVDAAGVVHVPRSAGLSDVTAVREPAGMRVEWLNAGGGARGRTAVGGGLAVRANGADVGELFAGPEDRAAGARAGHFRGALVRAAVAAAVVAVLFALSLFGVVSWGVFGPAAAGTVAPAGAVAPVVEALRPAASAAGVALTLDLDSAPAAVHADERRLKQVVRHLIERAVARSASGQTVRVDVAREGAAARFTVRDQSDGIATGEAARSLTAVKPLVEAMGGTVESRGGRGAGTALSFTLPLAEAAASSPLAIG